MVGLDWDHATIFASLLHMTQPAEEMQYYLYDNLEVGKSSVQCLNAIVGCVTLCQYFVDAGRPGGILVGWNRNGGFPYIDGPAQDYLRLL